MRKWHTIVLYFCLSIIIGCATVPSLRVSRPWIRSLESGQSIDPKKAVKIEVSGVTSPLLGSEQLTSDKLHACITQLVKRRGFSIDDNGFDYLLKLLYRTDRNDKMSFSSSIGSTNYQAFTISTESGAGATSGLGVSIARAVSILASRPSTAGTQSANQNLSYTHTISIEFASKEEIILWKGESTWDSQELDIINGIVPALQLLLSSLPSDKTYRPEIPEVKETHVENYYRLECKDVWFTCPALPYRILFPDIRRGLSEEERRPPMPSSIFLSKSRLLLNENAIAAYVDLLQTAEYALPDGNEKDWKDPLNISLWKNATLGGQYYLGPERKPINVLIKLVGKEDGYYISKCRIASDSEYSDFSKKLDKWCGLLSKYYDVYKY
jgi:hypothetical protein